MPKSGEIVEVKANELALPADLMAELRAEAKDAAAEERPSISKLSTQGGQLKYQGNPVPGNRLEVIVLAAVHRNVYYSERFNPNDIKNPDCFALAESEDDIQPHENVSKPKAQHCQDCTLGQWKSDPNGGKGKACKQSRRLVLIPASDGMTEEVIKKAEMAILDLPVTSAKAYGNFVNVTASTTGLPPYAVVCEVTETPDPKTQFKVNLQPIRVAGGAEVIRALKARKEDALRIGLTPYDETNAANSAVSEEQKARQEKAGKKF